MAKTSPYESGELTDSIFLIMLTTLKPIHGYAIMHKLEQLTHGAVVIGPATMYTTLKKLREAKWITTLGEEESKIEYQITKEGFEILQKDYIRRQQIVTLANKELEDYEYEEI